MVTFYKRGKVYWLRGSLAGKRVHRSTGSSDQAVAETLCSRLNEGKEPAPEFAVQSTKLEAVAQAIWRETYRHDTLLNWHEVKRGTAHHRRIMSAASAAIAALGGTDDGSVWMPIPGYPDYEASSNGHIRRARLKNGTPLFHALKPTESRAGHLKVSVYDGNGRQKREGVHRLVAQTFLGLSPRLSNVVCHIDGNPKNNRPENLRWGTYSDNRRDAIRHAKERWAARLPSPVTAP